MNCSLNFGHPVCRRQAWLQIVWNSNANGLGGNSCKNNFAHPVYRWQASLQIAWTSNANGFGGKNFGHPVTRQQAWLHIVWNSNANGFGVATWFWSVLWVADFAFSVSPSFASFSEVFLWCQIHSNLASKEIKLWFSFIFSQSEILPYFIQHFLSILSDFLSFSFFFWWNGGGGRGEKGC